MRKLRRILIAFAVACVAAASLFPVTALAEGLPEAQVSEGGQAALVDGFPFALDAFSRSQVGSNRNLDGVYVGYSYYIASTPENLVAVATQDYVVVYIPSSSAQATGFDLGNTDDQAALKSMLIGLDAATAKGGAALTEGMAWYMTEDQSYQVGGVSFQFEREVRTGQYYACVIGADGSDVTNPANPSYVQLTHADNAKLVAADQVSVAPPKTGLAALQEFLSTVDYSPLWVTLKTTGVAIVIIFILGLAAAYFSLRIPPRAQDVADSIFTIPMVLPPTVCGFLLLMLFGKNTGIGQWFMDIGFPLIFSWPATVVAAVVVAFPLMYRSARGAFEGLDPNMLDAARTLGWSNPKIFFRLMVPLSWSSIAAGTVLAFARALGEFGATLFLAGNFLGITRTIPIAIYFEWMNGNFEVALFWTVIIIIISFIVILFINLWGRRTTKWRKGAVK